MRRLVLRLVVIAGCALFAFPQASHAQPAQPDVRIGFGVTDGAIHLDVFSSTPFTIDPAALHFTLRPYRNFDVDGTARAFRAETTLGKPVLGGVLLRPSYDVTLSVAPPPKPGMYQLSAETDPGFARTADGKPLPLTRFPAAALSAMAAWWPDERGGDPGLRTIRTRFTGHVAHAYGQAVRSCETPRASWGTSYPAETPLHVEAVTRERGRVALLQVGSGTGDFAFRFLAFDPIALRITSPGEPSIPNVPHCPFVLRYADPWHIETALTVAAPPPFGPPRGFPVRVGMSRDEVVWRMGYPDQYGTVASFRALDRWTYVEPTPFAWWVQFKNDRVVDVHPPGNLP